MDEDRSIEKPEAVDALCKECGHGFKAYIDRIAPEGGRREGQPDVACPVCGCGECRIGR